MANTRSCSTADDASPKIDIEDDGTIKVAAVDARQGQARSTGSRASSPSRKPRRVSMKAVDPETGEDISNKPREEQAAPAAQ